MFDLEVDPAAGVAAFKRIVQEATGVPPDRQKLLGGKGLWSGILKDDTDLTKVTFMEGSVVSLTGTADVVKAPSAPVRFAEDIAAEESARREQKKPSSYSAYVHLAKKCPEMMSRDWSVRIVLPGPDAMDPSMIMSLVPPMIFRSLGEGTRSWQSRGWVSMTQFYAEIRACVGVSDTVVIARAQTEQEANELAMEISKYCMLSAKVEHVGTPLLLSTNSPPPPRAEDLEIIPSDMEITAPHNARPVYCVLIHVPPDCPPAGTTARAAWVSSWYTDGILDKVQAALGKKFSDGLGLQKMRYTWPERGWESSVHFCMHSRIALREGSTAVVARKQAYLEALFLLHRLKQLGLEVSLSSDDLPTALAYKLPPLPDESVADAAYKASKMASARSGMPGLDDPALHRMAAELGLPPPDQVLNSLSSGDDSSLEALSGHSPELINTFLEHLARAVGISPEGNGTKKSVKDALPAILVTSETRSNFSMCGICMENFCDGDEITNLPCGHYYHRGNKEVDPGVNRAGVGVHLGSGVDKEKYYCSRWIPSVGQCGPKDGPQCDDCRGFDLRNPPLQPEGVDVGEMSIFKMEGGSMKKAWDCCGGILQWLESKHHCPHCRFELEADNPNGIRPRVWSCPLCRRENTGERCMCGCRWNVIAVADDLCSAVFRECEELFFKCLDMHRQHRAGEGTSDVQEQEHALLEEIDTFVYSDVFIQLTSRGWDIAKTVETLLHSAFHGELNIKFCGLIDVNSRGLFAILYNRIKDRVAALVGSESAENALVFEEVSADEFCCPFCNEIIDDICQSCGVKKSAVAKARQEKEKLFKTISDLFIKIITKGRANEDQVVCAKDIQDEIECLLKSDEMIGLVEGNWDVIGCVVNLFRAASSGATHIAFEQIDHMDPNSRGLYACLVNQIRQELQSLSSSTPIECELERPFLSEDLSVRFTSHRFPISAILRGLLVAHKDMFLGITKMLVQGGRELEWNILYEHLLPKLTKTGWNVSDAVKLMRVHERDLSVLAKDLDPNSAALVEVLLGMVKKKESRFQASASVAEGVDHSETGKVQRQQSFRSQTKEELASLRSRLGTPLNTYMKILEFFMKRLRKIRSEPTNESHRLLRQDDQEVGQYLLMNQEIVRILSNIGFEEIASDLSLKLFTVNIGSLNETVAILQDEMNDVADEME